MGALLFRFRYAEALIVAVTAPLDPSLLSSRFELRLAAEFDRFGEFGDGAVIEVSSASGPVIRDQRVSYILSGEETNFGQLLHYHLLLHHLPL